MTIENRPQFDTDWLVVYRQQRYERLLDSISEYLCDDAEDSGATPFIQDLVRGLKETRDWPERQIKEVDAALEAIKNVS